MRNHLEVTYEVIPRDNSCPIEAIQEEYISFYLTPLCAWCLEEQGIPAGEGSHGICQEHADQMRLQQRKLRRHGNVN